MSEAPETIATVLQRAVEQLSASATARLDAELLLANCLDQSRSFLLSHGGEALSPAARERFARSVARRRSGEPVAYIVGRREFWSLDLEINPHVLVPRPETELLVEFALEVVLAGQHAKILDLGTGSGAIALAIAHERPDARVVATDASTEAITLACRNAERLKLGNVSFLVGHWYEPVGAMHFDLIVSNPPYIAADDAVLKTTELAAEPRAALVSGPSGLEAIERVAARACEHLRPGGWLALEHGAEQAGAVAPLFSAAGLSTIRTLKDLAGHDRVTAGRRPGA
ncbi:MAG TPA: peptide chain release factor N(5)-glutamine methyltransferase [Steroidobacteraceae bacterium]|nr:peptide chain release factor N(5)-glutamine methyltransferase [Steroidobacteraceae bacterium]